MAEGIVVEGKTVEELEREITCGVCQEHYTEPKILPCLHYYCKECILRLALRTATGKPFSCPECRSEATLPEGGVDELKTAFFVNRLKTTVSAMERTHGKVEVKCELCEVPKDNAEAFCRQCTSFICKECVNMHKRVKTFKSHEVASLDDLKQGRSKPVQVKEPPMEKCLVHEEPLTIYCYDCDSLICRDCTVKDHRDHNFEFAKKAAPNEKIKLSEEIKPLKKALIKLTDAVELIQKTKFEVESQKGSAVNTVKASFKELHEILDKREQELVEEIGTVSQEKVSKLSVQGKTLSLVCAEVQSVVDYTERSVRHCSDGEVMSMLCDMRKTIQKKIEEHDKSRENYDPVEVADIVVEVRCVQALKRLCQTQAIVTELVDTTKCTVHLEDVEVGKLSKAMLTARLSSNKEIKKHHEVSAQIKSLYNGVITDCNIDDDGAGKYSIHYTPTVRGYHELTVLIDEQHVAGSPFSVFVSIHPTQLGKPVKVWSDLCKPVGITINLKGEVLVTESRRNIIKFDANGLRHQIVAQNKLQALRCIAVDDDDNIYCIDEHNSKILTCNENGGNVQIHDINTKGGPGRRALTIVNNELLISETCNMGVIMVYDRELKHVRQIEHKNMGMVLDISADIHGNLYMTDSTNSCIQVFGADGVFLRSIGLNSAELQHPWGICLSGYLFTTDDTKHCVPVFTTDGVYVTSFGQKGNKEGDFNYPYYLCTDKHGFIYVTDFSNNRIQCF